MTSSSDRSPSERNENELLPTEVIALLAKITERFDSTENEEWQWIASHSADPQVVELFQDSTTMTLRVIDAIGRLEPVNGITIADHHRIPKGTVSKITRRLLAKDLIQAESLPHNKKEIWFRLTPLGRELFQVHRTFDEQMERGFIRFLQRYSADELRLIIRILHEATETSFLTLGLDSLMSQDDRHQSE